MMQNIDLNEEDESNARVSFAESSQDNDALAAVPTTRRTRSSPRETTTMTSAADSASFMKHIAESAEEDDEEHMVEFFKDEDQAKRGKRDDERISRSFPKRKHHHNRTRSMPVISLPVKSILQQPAPTTDAVPAPESKDDTHVNSLRPYKLQRKRSSTIGLLKDGSSKQFSEGGESEDNFPMSIPSIANGKEVDLSGRSKRAKICIVYVAVTAFALLASLLGFFLSGRNDNGDSYDKDNSKTGASAGGNNHHHHPNHGKPATSSPSMAPTEYGGLLKDKDEFSHYIVEWGIQTKGCQGLEWPKLELSCGEGDTNAVVQVLDQIVSKGFGETGQEVQCMRLHDNKIRCEMKGFSPVDADVDHENNKDSPPLFGTVLVACGGDKDPDQPGSAICSSLDLKAHIPLHSYATQCNLLASSDQVEEGQVFERRKGYAMPYVSMGRVCRGASFQFGDRRRRDNVRRRVSNNPALDFNDLFHVRTNGFCEQGTRTAVEFEFEGEERTQAFCGESSHCSTLRVCSSDQACTGSPSCDVPSGSILLDMVDFITDDDHEPCFFDQVLPEQWMWDLMASEMGKSPTLDTSA